MILDFLWKCIYSTDLASHMQWFHTVLFGAFYSLIMYGTQLVVIKFLNLIFVPMLSAKLTNFYCIMKKSLFITFPTLYTRTGKDVQVFFWAKMLKYFISWNLKPCWLVLIKIKRLTWFIDSKSQLVTCNYVVNFGPPWWLGLFQRRESKWWIWM
jgi:hypothetical protein